jgi:hypothetical protein
MKTTVRALVIVLALAAGAIAQGTVPAIRVLVSDSSGKADYKGVTDASGTFATAKLQPGNYVVQFSSTTAQKGARYTLVIAAGKKKLTANAIQAEKLNGAGVAMKIDVGSGLNITGQIAAEEKNSAPIGHNGKPMVWIGQKTGSNLSPHWAESNSAEAREVQTQDSINRKNLQDRQSQGRALRPGE